MKHMNVKVNEELMQQRKERQEANQKILNRLADYLRDNPGMTFSQALNNLNIVKMAERDGLYAAEDRWFWDDDYYLESVEVLKRMR